jgi:S-adenosylmethionine hydrolase
MHDERTASATTPERGLPPLVAVLTDFGIADSYVAQMKAVLLAGDRRTVVVDVTHAVPAGDVLEGAFQLFTVWDVFPIGTIFLSVVDPGVGTERRAIAAEFRGRRFVGPDNGLCSLAIGATSTTRLVTLDAAALLRRRVAATFHGRDLFAPAARLLALGAALDELGTLVDPGSLVRLDAARVEVTGDAVRAPVVSIDHFGNCRTLIRRDHLPGDPDALVIHAIEFRVAGLARTYGDVPEGAPLAYVGSHGGLELAVNGGSAARRFGIVRGDVVEVRVAR